MALVCCFVLFPETVNHAYLGLLSTILGKVKAMLMSQDGFLTPNPGDFGPGSPKLVSLAGDRAALMTMYQTREYRLLVLSRRSQSRFLVKGLTVHLKSEFSYGRWGGDDVLGLADPLLAVVSRLSMHNDLVAQAPP